MIVKIFSWCINSPISAVDHLAFLTYSQHFLARRFFQNFPLPLTEDYKATPFLIVHFHFPISLRVSLYSNTCPPFIISCWAHAVSLLWILFVATPLFVSTFLDCVTLWPAMAVPPLNVKSPQNTSCQNASFIKTVLLCFCVNSFEFWHRRDGILNENSKLCCFCE